MAVFKNDDDAINFAVLKIYWDVLHRRVESSQVLQDWIDEWKANGGSHVLAAIMDSQEGQDNEKAVRQSLGF